MRDFISKLGLELISFLGAMAQVFIWWLIAKIIGIDEKYIPYLICVYLLVEISKLEDKLKTK